MRIVIVNERDEVIGAKEREELLLADIYRVSALWITNSQEEILLAQRALTKKKAPGRWGPAVAGTVEETETYEGNIIKETEEELGLRVSGADLKIGPKIFIKREKDPYYCQWYYYATDKKIEEFVFPANEVAAIRWVSKTRLLEEFENSPDTYLFSTHQWLPKVLEFKELYG